jgi:DNA topoisomerase-2
MPEEKKVEDIYKKMSQKEHILARPDTYIGSTQSSDEALHILNDSNKIVSKTILFNQGLFKIFDEIIVNAADSYH